jgi:hypothetical protein
MGGKGEGREAGRENVQRWGVYGSAIPTQGMQGRPASARRLTAIPFQDEPMAMKMHAAMWEK